MQFISSLQLAGLSNLPFVLSNITAWELFDIIIVSIGIYIIILFVKQTKSYFVLFVSIGLLVLAFVAQNLSLSLTRALVQPISTLTFVIIAIVLQREIRQFFRWVMVGKNYLFSSVRNQVHKTTFTEVADALTFMSEKHIGAIIVFTMRQDIEDLFSGGQPLDGRISKEVLLSIFDSSSPGHDGAVIIENNMIKSFGVHLPLAQSYTHFRKAGTRHRAAAGISEGTDAVAFVVSEERGTISVFKNGTYTKLESTEALLKELALLSGDGTHTTTNFWDYFAKQNAAAKLIAISLSCIMWLVLFVQTGVVSKEVETPLSFQLLSPQYEIATDTKATQVTVTVQGKSNDIATLDVTKIKSNVDAKGLAPGTHTITLTPKNVSVPSFISVTDIEPDTVTVTVREKAPEPAIIEPIVEILE